MIRSLYKAQEPFMLATDGHGYLGVVMYDDVTDTVQCHICGKWFSNSGIHIAGKHKITSDEYKIRYGLTISTALCGVNVSKKLSVLTRDRMSKETMCNLLVIGRSKTRRKVRQVGGLTVARQNKFGLCELQIKARYEVVKKIVGKDPNFNDLNRYDKKLAGAMSQRGGLNKFREKIGVDSSGARPKEDDGLFLIARLRQQARDSGKTPSPRNFKGTTSVYKKFGSWSNALRVAGLK